MEHYERLAMIDPGQLANEKSVQYAALTGMCHCYLVVNDNRIYCGKRCEFQGHLCHCQHDARVQTRDVEVGCHCDGRVEADQTHDFPCN